MVGQFKLVLMFIDWALYSTAFVLITVTITIIDGGLEKGL